MNEQPCCGHHRPALDDRRYKLIACEIFCRELCRVVADSEHIIDVTFLRKGLHDAGSEVMSAEIQSHIDAADTDGDYQAILLGYARCNDGVRGLHSSKHRLIIPRAHDCITCFFGSRAAYDAYFSAHPGTYYRTSGWTERDRAGDDSVMTQLGLNQTFDAYVRQYGLDNARYLMETLGNTRASYTHLAYIHMGLPVDDAYAALARTEAADSDLAFEQLTGRLDLLSRLVNGPWDDDTFVTVPPGSELTSDDDGAILAHRRSS